ncbi:substrate-binding periplasmic protein [Chitinimonas sp. BJB300]|uniref:substrate-binding periplasmic protein n=1 Tax=Chitinimonas sp. BJB300 TaxID=1559339 RepID=UPI0013045686|nr:transporter substrate-binding domain-containing protein [Chitinimonas sp. BJB300]
MFPVLRLSLLFVLLPASATIRIGLCECDSPPLLEFAPQSTEPVGGLIKDIGDLIAGQMNEEKAYVVLSRKRIDPALQKGEVDLVCYLNPAWTSVAPQLHWTDDVVPQTEVVVVDRNRAEKVRNMEDLKGMRLGLIHGFHYPQLVPLIVVGKIKPVYENDHLSNYKLLEQKLVDGVVSSDLQVAYHQRNTAPGTQAQGVSALVLSAMPTFCAVPKASPIKVERVMQAVQQLKAQGAFDKLINRYRQNEHTPSKTERP